MFCEIFLTSFIFQGIARLQRHEQIVDEVKLALKPFFRHGEITKDDYKVIMRKSVEKVCLREFFQRRTCYYPEKQSLNRGETTTHYDSRGQENLKNFGRLHLPSFFGLFLILLFGVPRSILCFSPPNNSRGICTRNVCSRCRNKLVKIIFRDTRGSVIFTSSHLHLV